MKDNRNIDSVKKKIEQEIKKCEMFLIEKSYESILRS